MNPAKRPARNPLFLAEWDRVLMIHFEVDPAALQSETPFTIDRREGRAYVSLVAFTIRGMRLRWGGVLGRLLVAPIATHEFLNVRTYLAGDDAHAIQFLAEWLPNRISCFLGPRVFSLPYHLGKLHYHHAHETGDLTGEVIDAHTCRPFRYRARVPRPTCWAKCPAGSRDEWLMERYAACNCAGGRRRRFCVAHEPWLQSAAELLELDCDILCARWPWFHDARCVGANYSPGVRKVGMGFPECWLATDTVEGGPSRAPADSKPRLW